MNSKTESKIHSTPHKNHAKTLLFTKHNHATPQTSAMEPSKLPKLIKHGFNQILKG
jgi:hypothetical protein